VAVCVLRVTAFARSLCDARRALALVSRSRPLHISHVASLERLIRHIST
jgi:hypothetical protein